MTREGAAPLPGPADPSGRRAGGLRASTVCGVAGLLALTGLAVATLGPLTVRGAPMLRLRVVANSNRPADQAQKRAVRDAVVAEVAPVIRGVSTLGQARRVVAADLGRVRLTAEAAAGPATSVSVRLGPDRFPARSLGLLRFPAGSYDTLLVTLGSGQGHNWWTVLFPPFAFIGLGKHMAVVGPPNPRGAVEPAFRLNDPDVAIVGDHSTRAAPIVVRFALWDLWQQLAHHL